MKPFDFEHSEMLMYQNMVIQEAGLHQDAFQHMADHEKQIVDKLAVQETRGRMAATPKT